MKFLYTSVGGGISGLFAASILANAGLKIILLERDFIFGGFSNSSDQKVKNWINLKPLL